MITDNIYHQKLVSDYIDHGFAPIPIQYKSRQPVNKGWPDLRISGNDIGTYFNGVIKSACSLDATLRTSAKDLYDYYCEWCDISSIEPLHSTKFGKELTRLGYETFKTKRGNGRIGIGLKQSPATTRLLGTTGAGAKKQSMSLPVHACAPSVARQSLN